MQIDYQGLELEEPDMVWVSEARDNRKLLTPWRTLGLGPLGNLCRWGVGGLERGTHLISNPARCLPLGKKKSSELALNPR